MTPIFGRMVQTIRGAGRVLRTLPGAAPSDWSTEMHDDVPIPVGLCQCGCGQRTPMATHTNRALGKIKGQPTTCVPRHRRGTLRQRFMVKVHIEASGCWQWTGCIDSRTGYARIGIGKHRVTGAHRVAHELFKGPIPNGLHIDHLCRNRSCVNPEHLEAVSRRTNWVRGDHVNAHVYRTQTCKRGHPFEGHSYFRDGKRIYCRTCQTDMERARRHRRRHAAD